MSSILPYKRKRVTGVGAETERKLDDEFRRIEQFASFIQSAITWLTGSGVITVDTAQDLRDLPIYFGFYPKQVNTRGALTVGDGGYGPWYWDATSVADDNLGTVLLPTGWTETGRWIRKNRFKYIQAEWFGGVSNDALVAAIQAAVTAGTVQSDGRVSQMPTIHLGQGIWNVDPDLLNQWTHPTATKIYGLNLIGSGKFVTKLHMQENGWLLGDFSTDLPVTGVTISDLTLNGDSTLDRDVEYFSSNRGLLRTQSTSRVQNYIFERVAVNNFGVVFSMSGSNNDAEFTFFAVSIICDTFLYSDGNNQLYNWNLYASTFFIYGPFVHTTSQIGGAINCNGCNIIYFGTEADGRPAGYETAKPFLNVFGSTTESGNPGISFLHSRIETRGLAPCLINEKTSLNAARQISFFECGIYMTAINAVDEFIFVNVQRFDDFVFRGCSFPYWVKETMPAKIFCHTVDQATYSNSQGFGKVLFDMCLEGPPFAACDTDGTYNRGPIVVCQRPRKALFYNATWDGPVREWTYRSAVNTGANLVAPADDFQQVYVHRVALGKTNIFALGVSNEYVELPEGSMIVRIVSGYRVDGDTTSSSRSLAFEDADGTAIYTRSSINAAAGGMTFDATPADFIDPARGYVSGTQNERSYRLKLTSGGQAEFQQGYAWIEYI